MLPFLANVCEEDRSVLIVGQHFLESYLTAVNYTRATADNTPAMNSYHLILATAEGNQPPRYQAHALAVHALPKKEEYKRT